MSGWQCLFSWHVSIRNVFVRSTVRSYGLREHVRMQDEGMLGLWRWRLWASTVDWASIVRWRRRLWGAGSAGMLVLCSFRSPPFLRHLFSAVSVTSQVEHEVKRKESSNRLMSHTCGWSSSGAFGLFFAPLGLPLGLSVNPLPRNLGSVDEVSI